jgi:hypothetical protein
MSTITVKTQGELYAALEKHGQNPHAEIVIDSPRDVRLEISSSHPATVRATGSSTVRAYDSATVDACDSARVQASDSSVVNAYNSATANACGSATVNAYDSSTVIAYDSSFVRAHDLVAVDAYGSSVVKAYGLATVVASKYVAVYLHSANVTLIGGVVIDMTELNLNDPQTWADYVGARVEDGLVYLYKAVDDDFYAGHAYIRTRYPIGQTVTAPDWRDDNNCGGGLHVSPHVHQALAYYSGAARVLEITVPLTDIRPIGTDKAKARSVTVVREVDRDGNPLEVEP